MRRTCIAILASLSVWSASTRAQDYTSEKLVAVAVDRLSRQARERVGAKARTELMPVVSPVLATPDALEPAGSGRVPNYLRALSPDTRVSAFARLLKTVLYSGDVRPEIKMAMGLRTAQFNGSPYVAAHMQRFLDGTDVGAKLLKSIAADRLQDLATAEQLAVRYAEQLTVDVNGVSDESFRAVRGYYNDGQVVELTLTTAFFNYFTRMAEPSWRSGAP